MERKKLIILIGAGVVIFALGALGGHLYKGTNAQLSVTTVRNPQNTYKLINPILFIETSEALSYPKYTPLKNALTTYASSAKEAGKATEVSVYFRDLNKSNWVGIDPTEKFNPASMLKVATLMAVYHQAEANPSVLTENVTVPSSFVIDKNPQDFFPPANPVTSGQTYSVPDLLNRMILQSDNGANTLLSIYMGDSVMKDAYDTLNIPISSDTGSITAQQYSHLFRILYNASYLTPADSERALELLSHTNFTPGLVAGVPAGTQVAHKFGEATLPGMSASHELHDCGIVYYPGHPYFLCVMTRGSDFPTLEGVIQDISQITWKQVAALNA